MHNYLNFSKLLELTVNHECTIGQICFEREVAFNETSSEEIFSEMRRTWSTMQQAINQGLTGKIRSKSGMTGGDGKILAESLQDRKSLTGATITKAVARALAVAEVNAAMGKIVAAPTAGSCGILPATIMTVSEIFNADDEKIVLALFTAAAVGQVVALKTPIAGAEGGCQAECGVATSMAAAAAVELSGGSPAQAVEAVALGLKSMLGLTCDPVAGLVEVPCIKRNGFATTNALLAADMALTGIKSVIPADEVVDALKETAQLLPASLRETSKAGLAKTTTALKWEAKLKTGDE